MARPNPLPLILSRLEGVKRSGEGHVARCPAHEDRTPSLGITVADDGRVLINCLAGCDVRAVVRRMGLQMSDLFEGAEPRQAPVPLLGPPTLAELAEHLRLPEAHLRAMGLEDGPGGVQVPYRDREGRELYRKVRARLTGKPKYVFPRLPPGEKRLPQAPYGLWLMGNTGRSAVRPARIYVEGECLPGDAEVLTADGWTRLDQYQPGTPVAQWSEGGEIDMVVPSGVVRRYHVGVLVEVTNRRGYYAGVTPEHRLVGIHTYHGRLERRRAGEGAWPSTWRIPRVGHLDGSGIGFSDDELALALACSADASIHRRVRTADYMFFHLTKPGKIERLRGLLDRLGVEYRDTADPRGIEKGRRFIKFIMPERLAHVGRLLPNEWLTEASSRQRELILTELVEWDGNRVPRRRQTEFASKHWHNASWVQAMAHTADRCSTIMKRRNALGEWYKVSILNGKVDTRWHSLRVDQVPYDGKVYCLTVPSGMFLVRQRGVVSVTGNSDTWALAYHGAPVLGVPGNTSDAVLGSEHCEGLAEAYIVQEPGPSGEVFVKRVGERLREVGYRGKLYAARMPRGVKDPAELHALDPDGFLSALRRCLRSARPWGEDLRRLVLRLSDVERRSPSFLWRPYLVAGTLNLAAGRQGLGKGHLTAALAAAISAGAPLPGEDEEWADVARPVLLFAAEDTPEEVLRPRLEDNGADLERCYTYDLVRNPFSLAEEGLRTLSALVDELEPALVVIDPIIAFAGGELDLNSQSSVRGLLQPLLDLAADKRICILAVHYVHKGSAAAALDAISGSLDFSAAPRSALLVAKDPQRDGARLVAHAKHNLSAPGQTLRYRIEGTRIRWDGVSSLSADDLAGAQMSYGERIAVEEAEDLLRRTLSGGRRKAKDLIREAKVLGVGGSALLMARHRLGVVTTEWAGDTCWALSEADQKAPDWKARAAGEDMPL